MGIGGGENGPVICNGLDLAERVGCPDEVLEPCWEDASRTSGTSVKLGNGGCGERMGEPDIVVRGPALSGLDTLTGESPSVDIGLSPCSLRRSSVAAV